MIAALVVTLLAQQPGAIPAADAVLVELPSGLAVSIAEYREHLHRMLGGARLEELLLDRALEREVAALPAIPAEPAAVLADPEAAARRRVVAKVAEQFAGDAARHAAWLATVGLTTADELTAERVVAVRDARIDAVVRARRVVDERALRRLFDERYGVDGLAVEVRHRLFAFTEARQRVTAGGGEVAAERVETLALAAARAALDRARDDPRGFAVLDPEPIENYRFQRFGVEFAAAVRAAEVDAVVGPVRSAAGFHLVQVTRRTETRFAAVRDALLDAARRAPAAAAEWRSLRGELLERYGIRGALDARVGR